jgi:hypothetical protein
VIACTEEPDASERECVCGCGHGVILCVAEDTRRPRGMLRTIPEPVAHACENHQHEFQDRGGDDAGEGRHTQTKAGSHRQIHDETLAETSNDGSDA